jgi:hypothetical protein
LLAFGPPPLLDGEDIEAYDDLLARISAGAKPTDIIEDIWVRDFADLVWETHRLRRLKAALIKAETRHQLKEMLELRSEEEVDELVEQWAQQKTHAIKQVDRLLDSLGMTMDMVIAEVLRRNISPIERIDTMIAMAEARRIAILREIGRHRATLANSLRRNTEQIEDAEYRVLEDKARPESRSA